LPSLEASRALPHLCMPRKWNRSKSVPILIALVPFSNATVTLEPF
jgi:hypothetical protein